MPPARHPSRLLHASGKQSHAQAPSRAVVSTASPDRVLEQGVEARVIFSGVVQLQTLLSDPPIYLQLQKTYI